MASECNKISHFSTTILNKNTHKNYNIYLFQFVGLQIYSITSAQHFQLYYIMEFHSLGKYCNECRKQDFLFRTCDGDGGCGKHFCTDHIRGEDHSCVALKIEKRNKKTKKIKKGGRAKTKERKRKQCEYVDCKRRPLMLSCKHCKKHYCIYHSSVLVSRESAKLKHDCVGSSKNHVTMACWKSMDKCCLFGWGQSFAQYLLGFCLLLFWSFVVFV